MQDFLVVECFETFDNLDKYHPDMFLFNVNFIVLVFTNPLENIPIICKFHNDTKKTNEAEK